MSTADQRDVVETQLGELLPWTVLQDLGLLWTIPHERKTVDLAREAEGPAL